MFYGFCIVLFALDQFSKWFIVQSVENRPLLGDLLRVTLTENSGAAFGLFPGARAIFIVVSIVAAIGLVYAHHVMKSGEWWRHAMLGLILGGNLGNLADRVRLGHVIDFIDMGIGTTRWPVYNVADMGVVIGAVGLALSLFAESAAEKRVAEREQRAASAPVTEENSADAR